MRRKRWLAAVCILLAMLLFAGCTGGAAQNSASAAEAGETSEETSVVSELVSEVSEASEASEAAEEPQTVEKNGEVYILFTSDIHCGIEDGFGMAGLVRIRQNLEDQGYTTILVDDGDAVQGGTAGTLTKGEAVIGLMNLAGYDVAIPGNHEFDYGMEQFMHLTDIAEFPYISCNFTKNGEPVFAPYKVLEAAGMKIGFVGVTTPTTFTTSTPKFFQNDEGEFIYGFMQESSGHELFTAVQNAVDAARAEGADYVYVLGHMGLEKSSAGPWTYADIIENTTGIDAFLDGHSHDTEQVVMKNKDGQEVVRSACGTKLNCIGYSHITPEKGIEKTGIWSWPNDISAPELLGLTGDISTSIRQINAELDAIRQQVIAAADVELTVNDPEAKDDSGNPIRMIRRAETNLGDLCADAFRIQTGADAAVIGGGAIRKSIAKGDLTYGNLLDVFPFGNQTVIIKVTGQQILDALEWGARKVPAENGGFLQVSGITYTIDVSVPSGCTADERNIFTGVEGPYRVKDVTIGGEPLDPAKTYTLAGQDYTLINHGDGYTCFDGAEVINSMFKLDNQVLIDYLTDTLGGRAGEGYEDLAGQGRINIIGG